MVMVKGERKAVMITTVMMTMMMMNADTAIMTTSSQDRDYAYLLNIAPLHQRMGDSACASETKIYRFTGVTQ